MSNARRVLRAIALALGATAGVRVGNKFGLFLETSYLTSVSSDFDAFQVNGSLFF